MGQNEDQNESEPAGHKVGHQAEYEAMYDEQGRILPINVSLPPQEE